MQSILVNIFRTGVLHLSGGMYEATAATTAAVFSHSKQFLTTYVQFGIVWKAFLPRQSGKKIAIIL